MRVLDLDLDFFQEDVCIYRSDYGERVDSNYTTAWNKERFVNYLENKLGLKKETKIKGRIFSHHQEAFYFWRELILERFLEVPFDVVHIDAHADLGFGDGSFDYLTTEYMYLDYESKIYPERLVCKKYGKQQFSFSNYLIFAVACGWINSIDYILHYKNYKGIDLPRGHFKNYDIDTDLLQLKRYKQFEELGIGYYRKLEDIEIIDIGKEIEFKCYKDNKGYYDKNFDFISLSISPGYTVQEADELIEVLKDYIEEI